MNIILTLIICIGAIPLFRIIEKGLRNEILKKNKAFFNAYAKRVLR